MTPAPGAAADSVYDLIGVGFGPSNLALSIATVEAVAAGRPLRRLFLERAERFGWHRDMLIDDATMQVAFLKDLATPRNPVSRFGFVSYLWSKGRLAAFINHKTWFPTRIEFHDYLEWAAAQVADTVRYAAEVVDVQPVYHGDDVVSLDVVSVRPGDPTGARQVRRTRNLVIATGLRPLLPPGVEPGVRVWHSSQLLGRTAGLSRDEPLRFAVVGAGQSAAECVAYLHRTFERAEVHAVFGRYGYSPSDDSPFANQVFDPAAVEEYFGAPEAVKQRFFDYHANTNYSVVDIDVIEDLYRTCYREGLTGRRRLLMHRMSAVADHEPTGDDVRLSVDFLPTGTRTALRVDYAVYATGYQPADPLRILGRTAGLCVRDDRGRLRVGRDYRLVTRPELRCGIYLQGGTEHTHGLSSSLLSNVAVRSGEILDSIQCWTPDGADRLTATAGLGLTGAS